MSKDNFKHKGLKEFMTPGDILQEANTRKEAMLLSINGMKRTLQYLHGLVVEYKYDNDLTKLQEKLQDLHLETNHAFDQMPSHMDEFYDGGALRAIHACIMEAEIIEDKDYFDDK